jgi:hypothetical protein
VGTFGFVLSLDGVDPGKGNYESDDEREEKQLDPDRQPDQAFGPPRARAASLAVGGVPNQLGAALVASHLDLFHGIEYATPSKVQ